MPALSAKNNLQFIDAMKSLLELEYEVTEVYTALIKNLESKKHQSKLKEFKDDHMRHSKGISYILEQLDQKIPKNQVTIEKLTLQGVPVIKLTGDKTIFKSLERLADNTNTAYEKVSHIEPKSPMASNILRLALQDGNRHRIWLQTVSS